MSFRASFAGLISLPLLAGCSSQQSAFHPTGHDAEQINLLFWVMTLGGAATFVLILILAAIAITGSERVRSRLGRAQRWWTRAPFELATGTNSPPTRAASVPPWMPPDRQLEAFIELANSCSPEILNQVQDDKVEDDARSHCLFPSS